MDHAVSRLRCLPAKTIAPLKWMESGVYRDLSMILQNSILSCLLRGVYAPSNCLANAFVPTGLARFDTLTSIQRQWELRRICLLDLPSCLAYT